MTTKVQNYLEEKMDWRRGADPDYPYATEVDGEKLLVRVNDFPDERLYTLLVNEEEVTSFDDWPSQWKR